MFFVSKGQPHCLQFPMTSPRCGTTGPIAKSPAHFNSCPTHLRHIIAHANSQNEQVGSNPCIPDTPVQEEQGSSNNVSNGDTHSSNASAEVEETNSEKMKQCLDHVNNCLDTGKLRKIGAWVVEEDLACVRDSLLACAGDENDTAMECVNLGGINACMRAAAFGSIPAYECLQSMLITSRAAAGKCIQAGLMSCLETGWQSSDKKEQAVVLFVLASIIGANRDHSYIMNSNLLPEIIDMIRDASLEKVVYTFNMRTNSSASRACSILSNLAHNMKNHQIILDAGGAVALSEFIKEPTHQLAPQLKAVFALAMLIGKKDSGKSQQENSLLELDFKTLENMMTACFKALDKDSAFGYHFALWKVLQAVSQITLLDRNSTLLLELRVDRLLCESLSRVSKGTLSPHIKNQQLVQRFALAAVWNLAFLPAGRQALLAQPELLELVREAANNNFSQKVQHEARGALWTLGDREYLQSLGGSSVGTTDVATGNCKGRVMLSHATEDSMRAELIRGELESYGFTVLVHSGSCLEHMAHTVETADAVLCSCSSSYQESQLCRTEAEYAYNQRKPILPITIENGFVPTGWLGALAGTSQALEMHDERLIPEMTEKLNTQLLLKFKVDIEDADDGATRARSTSSVGASFRRDANAAKMVELAQWTADDVTTWMTKTGINKRSVERWRLMGMDGRALVGLILLQKDRSLAKTLKVDLCIRNPVELLHLVYELQQLVV